MTQKRIMRKFKVNEISGVDRPAQIGARAVIMKRDSGYDNPNLLSDVKGHSHIIDLSANGGETSYSKAEGEEYGHTHPWVVTMAGGLVIGAAVGHTHDVLAKRDTTNGGNAVGDQATTVTAEQHAAVEANLAKAQADLATANAINALSDQERGMFKSLDPKGQGEFLALTPADRASRITKAAGENPVTYTDAEGNEFRKNDDPRLIGMAKRADAERTARLASDERNSRASFEKRATDELPNLPGDVNVKVSVLKAIDGIKDEAQRTGALALLKAGNEAMQKSFVTKGTSQGSVPSGNKSDASAAADQLESFAKAYAVTNKVDFYTAYDAVCAQHQDLAKVAVQG